MTTYFCPNVVTAWSPENLASMWYWTIPLLERLSLRRKCRFPVPAKTSPVHGFVPSKVNGVVVETPGPAVALVAPMSAPPPMIKTKAAPHNPVRRSNRTIFYPQLVSRTTADSLCGFVEDNVAQGATTRSDELRLIRF